MDYVGYIATVLTIGAFVPQTYKAVKTRQTRDLALATYGTIVVTGILWTIYSIGIHSSSLYITNSAVGLLALTICIMKIIEDGFRP